MPASYSARACFKATNCEHCAHENNCGHQAFMLFHQMQSAEILTCRQFRPAALHKEHETANASAQLALLDTTKPVQTTLF